MINDVISEIVSWHIKSLQPPKYVYEFDLEGITKRIEEDCESLHKIASELENQNAQKDP